MVYALTHKLTRLIDNLLGAVGSVTAVATFVDEMSEHMCHDAGKELLAAHIFAFGNAYGIAVECYQRVAVSDAYKSIFGREETCGE